ncbi:hypothetical protein GFV14_00632 [Candidatus Hartigia pinicola]|nr:hypothetical protein GFV14_00632 [Candidatus Hartigia pinicola]
MFLNVYFKMTIATMTTSTEYSYFHVFMLKNLIIHKGCDLLMLFTRSSKYFNNSPIQEEPEIGSIFLYVYYQLNDSS